MSRAPDDERTEVAGAAALLEKAVAALGGRRRDGQVRMAEAVDEALASGQHLLVQAGTGTGKSLGYLVPAVRRAVVHDERVVVSTATLALQRQVLSRDLPLVAEAVAPSLPRPPVVALLKGWHNYLCRHKLAGGYPDEDPVLLDVLPADGPGAVDHPRPGGLGSHVVRLREWAESTSTGDRDDLEPGVPDRAWRQVSVTALECLGTRCPLLAECFPEQARAGAREADVVVTNHAMLGIAAGGSPGALPEHDVLVVDEAHELADRVTAQATVELSAGGVEIAARTARRHGGVAAEDLEVAGRDLAAVLSDVPEGRLPDGLPDGVGLAVAAVRDASRRLLSELRPAAGTAAAADGGPKMAAAAVLALHEVAERMTSDAATDGRDVLWCSRGRRGEEAPRLHAAPLAVSGLVRTHLLEGRTAVLTSATLALGGSFDAVARSVGLGDGTDGVAAGEAPAAPPEESTGGGSGARPSARPAWRGLDVGSPFDHAGQGILYVARRLPPPGRDGIGEAHLAELVDLVDASGGATLGLFSSRRAAERAAEVLRERLPYPVLCQGDDQLPTLVRRFAEDEATCLVGTLSLWQGVDVPGRTSRLVVVDRIPFPRPDDPVRSARSAAVERSGGNGFMAVAATHAALLLAQGAGRLLRSDEDRGVVAVLDPRLAHARYASFLLRSLPPYWRTTDGEVVRAALRRLAVADAGPATVG